MYSVGYKPIYRGEQYFRCNPRCIDRTQRIHPRYNVVTHGISSTVYHPRYITRHPRYTPTVYVIHPRYICYPRYITYFHTAYNILPTVYAYPRYISGYTVDNMLPTVYTCYPRYIIYRGEHSRCSPRYTPTVYNCVPRYTHTVYTQIYTVCVYRGRREYIPWGAYTVGKSGIYRGEHWVC